MLVIYQESLHDAQSTKYKILVIIIFDKNKHLTADSFTSGLL
jgi:hypothetical protein